MRPSETPANVIVVQGRATADASPDVAVLHLSLEAEADSAGAALGAVSERATSVRDSILAAHVDAADLRTTGINLFPQMDPGGMRIHHYNAAYGFQVYLRDISAGPSLIEAISVSAGDALRLGGLQMSISDTGAASAEAAARAVADARRRAERLAGAAGVHLGRVVSIVEGPATGNPMPMRMTAVAAGGPPIQPGTDQVGAEVTVTFEISG